MTLIVFVCQWEIFWIAVVAVYLSGVTLVDRCDPTWLWKPPQYLEWLKYSRVSIYFCPRPGISISSRDLDFFSVLTEFQAWDSHGFQCSYWYFQFKFRPMVSILTFYIKPMCPFLPTVRILVLKNIVDERIKISHNFSLNLTHIMCIAVLE